MKVGSQKLENYQVLGDLDNEHDLYLDVLLRKDEFDDGTVTYGVSLSSSSLSKEQAKNLFDYLVRPFFYDPKICGLNIPKKSDL